jgi:hypothetical protein
MTKPTFSDEQLMLYADGDADEHTAAAIREQAAQDPAIAARIEMFAASRRLLRNAFEPVMHEPVPPRLLGTIQALGADTAPSAAKVVPFPRRARVRARTALPRALAASIALLLVFCAGWWSRDFAIPRTGSNVLVAEVAALPAPVASALDRLPSGETVPVRFGSTSTEVVMLASYRSGNAVCREFEAAPSASSAAQPVRGLACREDNRWVARAVAAAETAPASNDSYQPASGTNDLAKILGPVSALSATDEKKLLADGWQAETSMHGGTR